jgi:hypothetical protein
VEQPAVCSAWAVSADLKVQQKHGAVGAWIELCNRLVRWMQHTKQPAVCSAWAVSADLQVQQKCRQRRHVSSSCIDLVR